MSNLLPNEYNPCDENQTEKNRGHIWITSDKKWKDGSQDPAYIEFAEDPDSFRVCAGPQCSVCGYSYCVMCYPEGPNEDCEGLN